MTVPYELNRVIKSAQLEGNDHRYYSEWREDSENGHYPLVNVIDSNGDGVIDVYDTLESEDSRESIQWEVTAIRNSLVAELTDKIKGLKNAIREGKAMIEKKEYNMCEKIFQTIQATTIQYHGITVWDFNSDGTYEDVAFVNRNGVGISIHAMLHVGLFDDCAYTRPHESLREYLNIIDKELGQITLPKI